MNDIFRNKRRSDAPMDGRCFYGKTRNVQLSMRGINT